MGVNRRAARRDDNEPAIRKRFASHGWHTEQLSGTGMPDLLAFNLRVNLHSTRLVDVKMPDGKVTNPQVKKWSELAANGIPVYVVRTEADVDALVASTLEAWSPEAQRGMCGKNGCRRLRPCVTHDDTQAQRRIRANYSPPCGNRMDAAKVAEETFAPAEGSEAWERGER